MHLFTDSWREGMDIYFYFLGQLCKYYVNPLRCLQQLRINETFGKDININDRLASFTTPHRLLEHTRGVVHYCWSLLLLIMARWQASNMTDKKPVSYIIIIDWALTNSLNEPPVYAFVLLIRCSEINLAKKTCILELTFFLNAELTANKTMLVLRHVVTSGFSQCEHLVDTQKYFFCQ